MDRLQRSQSAVLVISRAVISISAYSTTTLTTPGDRAPTHCKCTQVQDCRHACHTLYIRTYTISQLRIQHARRQMIHRPADSVPADSGSIMVGSLCLTREFLVHESATVKCIERYCSTLHTMDNFTRRIIIAIISQNANFNFEKARHHYKSTVICIIDTSVA